MRFLRSLDTLSLFLHDIMTCMHISKKYNEIHGGRTNLTIRKHAKILTTPHKFRPKTLDSTDTVNFTHFRHTVNQYCGSLLQDVTVIDKKLKQIVQSTLRLLHCPSYELVIPVYEVREAVYLSLTFKPEVRSSSEKLRKNLLISKFNLFGVF